MRDQAQHEEPKPDEAPSTIGLATEHASGLVTSKSHPVDEAGVKHDRRKKIQARTAEHE